MVLAVLLCGSAEVPRRPLVGLLKSNSIPQFEEAEAAIRKTLERDALRPEILAFDLEGKPENAGDVLARIRATKLAVIVTVGSLATTVVLDGGVTPPVVLSMVLYPRQSGFLDRSPPVTGVSLDIPPASAFAYFRRLLPAGARVGVLYNPAETGALIEEAKHAASRQGLELVAESVSDPALAVEATEAILGRVDALWSVADSHVFSPKTTPALILAALRHRVPLFGLSVAHVRAGSVAALSANYADVGVQTAEVVLRLLRGEDASGMPVAAPRKVELSLNLRTAQHVGLAIPEDVEREAWEVIR